MPIPDSAHSKLSQAERVEVGVTDGLFRLSIGLENCGNIWGDLEQALRFLSAN